MSQKFDQVMRGDLCAGCGGCAAIAPTKVEMQPSQSGHLRPQKTAEFTLSEAARFEAICPGVGQTYVAEGRPTDPLWGPVLDAYTGFSTDPELRLSAASGGALSGFLLSLLDGGEVDAVVHIRADPANPLGNATTVSTTRDEIIAASGSRYAPSSPLDIVPRLLGDGRRYAFVGKPCDVSAVHALRQIDPEVARSFPILVSFFCAGVPSIEGSRQVVAEMGVPEPDLAFFQHRGAGWPGQATAVTKAGARHVMSYARSWGDILSKVVQHRCKICADGTGMFADVVFADAWEADHGGYPSFDDRPGQSLILARTDLGQRLLAKAINKLHTASFDIASLAAIQPGQVRRRRVLLARLAALWLMRQPRPHYRGFGLWRAALHAPVSEILRNFAGMARRVWRARAQGDASC